jgi:predicted regulator of Ras-like GTPase activity (Roadblock/LC7/MglB family)
VDPERALRDLTEISSQIRAAAIFQEDGTLVASTFAAEEAGKRFVHAARTLLQEAEEARAEAAGRLVQLEAATDEGSVFLVREGDRAVAAVTRPEPTAGLVFYDLKSCLRALAAEEGDGRPRPQPAAAPAEEATGKAGGEGAA